MKLVILESPYKGRSVEEQIANINYAQACAHDSLVNHHEAPFPSHLLYTQDGILDDKIPTERQLGIDAGLSWGSKAEATVVYIDRGISPGMQYGIKNAHQSNRLVIYRALQKRNYRIVTFDQSVELVDMSKPGPGRFDAVINPGVYATTLIPNPSGDPEHSNWLLIVGTTIGATVEWVRNEAISIATLS
mgnify:CR=1 FL=1